MQIRMLPVLAGCAALIAAAPAPDAALRAGDFDTARRGYVEALATRPDDVAARLGLARTELYANDLNAADSDLRRVLAADPQNVDARRLAAVLAQRTGSPGTFVITQQGNAVLPFVSRDPLPIVEMRINGASARVMIDTGAPVLVVTAAFAKNHGLAVRSAGEGIFAGGRRAPVQATTIDELSAGPLTVRTIPANVMDGPGLDAPGGRVDAIVGTGFFTRFLATLDYPHGRLILRPASVAPPATLIPPIPMWLIGDHFVFARASVNNGPPALFLVDSGAQFGVSLTKAALDAAGIVPRERDAQPFLGGGGETHMVPFTAPSLALGDARQSDVSGAYFPDGDPYGAFPFTIAGTISGGFLDRYAVTFDFRAMRLRLGD